MTLNRPEKRNAMNPTLNLEMLEVSMRSKSDDEARVLVLTGAGSPSPRAWTSRSTSAKWTPMDR